MKLIKLNTDHYIIVDESIQPVNGYYYDSFVKKIYNTSGAEYGEANHCLQITHSTQSLEVIAWKGKTHLHMDEYHFDKIQKISLQEVKELIGEVDVENKAEDWFESKGHNIYNHYNEMPAFIEGYNQALEDNKDRKYTEEDMKNALFYALNHPKEDGVISITRDSIVRKSIQSLQPKTEWEVEIVDGKLKLAEISVSHKLPDLTWKDASKEEIKSKELKSMKGKRL